jgi:amino acid transporter
MDGVLHMSDEVKKVRTRVPHSIIFAVTSNAVMMFGWVLVLLFRLGDFDKVAGSKTGLPLIEVYYEATRSKTFTTLLVLMPAYLQFCALFNVFASVSRLVWQFAKDNGTPFPKTLSYVHPTLRLPLNSLALVGTCGALLALIYIASSTAFQAIVSLTGIAFNISYMPPIFFLLFRRLRGDPPEFGKFRLGKWGVPMNVFALCYLAFIVTWMPFPSGIPVIATMMNYAGPVFGGICICAILDWFISGRTRFHMPVRP